MAEQGLWQLQNAMETAERNLTENVTISAWPGWIGYLLEILDDYCKAGGYDADAMLLSVRDVIDCRLQNGRW